MQIPTRPRRLQCGNSSRRYGRRQKILSSAPMWHAPPPGTKALPRPNRPPHLDTHNRAILCSRIRWACDGSTVCSHNGTSHESSWPVYPRPLRGRQVEIYGCATSCSSRAWWSPWPQDAFYLQRKLGYTVICWLVAVARTPQICHQSNWETCRRPREEQE